MKTAKRPLRPWVVIAVAAMVGGAMAVLYVRNGRYVPAAMAFVLVTGLGAVLSLSNSDWASAQSSTADERQEKVSLEATRLAFAAVSFASVIGAFGELAANDPGPFTLVCAVGGFVYMAAIAVLLTRR